MQGLMTMNKGRPLETIHSSHFSSFPIASTCYLQSKDVCDFSSSLDQN